MCLMCFEIMKGRMTIQEGRKALSELVKTTEKEEDLAHYLELAKLSDEEFQKLAQEVGSKMMVRK